MGINPKIGITGLPRSGKSAVLQKVVDMISEEGSGFRRTKGPSPPEHIIGGMRCEPCLLYTSPSPRDLSTSRMPSSA